MNDKMTAKELALKLRVSQSVIYRWSSMRLIPRVPGLGSRILRFDPDQIEKWLAAGGIDEARQHALRR